MATPSNANGVLVFWDEANKELEPHIKDKKSEYRSLDYKPNAWHSVCTTWDSESGLVQLWFNGQFLMKKFSISGSNIRGTTIIILGQVRLSTNCSISGFTRYFGCSISLNISHCHSAGAGYPRRGLRPETVICWHDV